MEEGLNTKDLYEEVKRVFGEPKGDVKQYSPLTHAFIGDAVYTLIVATMVVNKGNTANSKLHSMTEKYVSARAQAAAADHFLEKGILSEEELAVYKRGENAKPRSMAKNATPYEYHKATGFEALMGYLYQTGRIDRCMELAKIAVEQQRVIKNER